MMSKSNDNNKRSNDRHNRRDEDSSLVFFLLEGDEERMEAAPGVISFSKKGTNENNLTNHYNKVHRGIQHNTLFISKQHNHSFYTQSLEEPFEELLTNVGTTGSFVSVEDIRILRRSVSTIRFFVGSEVTGILCLDRGGVRTGVLGILLLSFQVLLTISSGCQLPSRGSSYWIVSSSLFDLDHF